MHVGMSPLSPQSWRCPTSTEVHASALGPWHSTCPSGSGSVSVSSIDVPEWGFTCVTSICVIALRYAHVAVVI